MSMVKNISKPQLMENKWDIVYDKRADGYKAPCPDNFEKKAREDSWIVCQMLSHF